MSFESSSLRRRRDLGLSDDILDLVVSIDRIRRGGTEGTGKVAKSSPGKSSWKLSGKSSGKSSGRLSGNHLISRQVSHQVVHAVGSLIPYSQCMNPSSKLVLHFTEEAESKSTSSDVHSTKREWRESSALRSTIPLPCTLFYVHREKLQFHSSSRAQHIVYLQTSSSDWPFL